MNNVWIYIICMAAVTYLIRVLPLTLIKKPIKNKTIRSFLYYVPYVTLAVMTFPAILDATQSPVAAAVAFILAIVLAYMGKGLFFVAVSACVSVFVLELIIGFIVK
jgi:branched-subunit amino acid transport protein